MRCRKTMRTVQPHCFPRVRFETQAPRRQKYPLCGECAAVSLTTPHPHSFDSRLPEICVCFCNFHPFNFLHPTFLLLCRRPHKRAFFLSCLSPYSCGTRLREFENLPPKQVLISCGVVQCPCCEFRSRQSVLGVACT